MEFYQVTIQVYRFICITLTKIVLIQYGNDNITSMVSMW